MAITNQDIAKKDGRFHCGTLSYTKTGLWMLFNWLLWSDFSFTIVGAASGVVMTLMMKSHGASNTLIAMVLSTIPSVMNFVLNPIISTSSDRLRSRWGRRRPFIFVSTPFIVLFLILIGFSSELGRGLHAVLGGFFPSLSVADVTLGLICVLNTGYIFASLFVGTVFYYIFNDVVPAQFMGRFLGLFRVVSSLAGALFNFFLLQYAETHTAQIFVSAAILYGVAFTLMTWKVREGEYPPPPASHGFNLSAWVRSFAAECFSHRIYRRVFIYNGILGIVAPSYAFMVFMALSIGLDLKDFGVVAGMASMVGMLLMYPAGVLVDRFHPMRVMLAAKIAFCLVCSIQFVFLFHDFSKPVAFWIYIGVSALTIPISAANTAAGMPLLMTLFPKEKFGQFCAANAMCSSAGVVLGGGVIGIILDLIKTHFKDGDFCYRFVPVYQVTVTLVALGTMLLLFREWKKLGGDTHYQPPE